MSKFLKITNSNPLRRRLILFVALQAKQDLTEKEVNEVLKARSTFGDHVQIRRSLIENGLMKRTIDGAIYRRIERKPPQEAQLFLRSLMKR